jgi:hypothetical protein
MSKQVVDVHVDRRVRPDDDWRNGVLIVADARSDLARTER